MSGFVFTHDTTFATLKSVWVWRGERRFFYSLQCHSCLVLKDGNIKPEVMRLCAPAGSRPSRWCSSTPRCGCRWRCTPTCRSATPITALSDYGATTSSSWRYACRPTTRLHRTSSCRWSPAGPRRTETLTTPSRGSCFRTGVKD